MQKTSRKQSLSLDTIRVETFDPHPGAVTTLLAPPTANPQTFPPCCSDVLVCA